MACREYSMLLRETSYGVPDLDAGAPKAGSFEYVRLERGDDFTLRAKPVRKDIPMGGGCNVPALRIGQTLDCTGTLRATLYREQTAFLMNWASTRVNDGRTLPWPTTDASGVMPPGDLASVSVYHAIQDAAGNYRRRAYRGVKVSSLTVEASEQNPEVSATLQLIAAKPDPDQNFGGVDSTAPSATEFPFPDPDDFPKNPYLFQHSTLKIGATVSQYAGWTLTLANNLEPRRFESRWLQLCRFYGREVTLRVPLYYKTTPDYEADFETQAAKDVELVLNDGTGTSTFDLHANARYTDQAMSLPLTGSYLINTTLKSLYSEANSADFSFSYA